MLFRRSTRKRFIFLVIAFLFVMGFNCHSYIKKYHLTEIQKKEILDEKAFKVFFLRFKTSNDLSSFLRNHIKNLNDYGSFIIKDTFIYQNNLYIPFCSQHDTSSTLMEDSDKYNLSLFYDLFGLKGIVKTYTREINNGINQREIKDLYVDYNGNRLDDKSLIERHNSLQRDLFDIAYMLRDGVIGKRIDVYNSISDSIINSIERIPSLEGHNPNPYLSRVECIIPIELLFILSNIRNDNTTDFVELSESVRSKRGKITTFEPFLNSPEEYSVGPIFKDVNAYPRYLSFVNPGILKPEWNWLLYQDIRLDMNLINYFDQLHFKGYFMFSYEKQLILRDKVEKTNRDIRSNHIQFYLSDLSMGIAFPFIISLFAFIHLKGELAFLLMFKNRIREILAIFWLIPVVLMILVKGGMLSVYLLYSYFTDSCISVFVIIPLVIMVVIASILFIPVNKYCFGPFTGDRLNLYALHRG